MMQKKTNRKRSKAKNLIKIKNIHLEDVECENLIETNVWKIFENKCAEWINKYWWVSNRGLSFSEVSGKTTIKYKVSNINEIHGTEFTVEYLKNIEKLNTFSKTEEDPEKFEVDREDIILMLPAPNVVATRRGQQLSFPMSFDGCNLG